MTILAKTDDAAAAVVAPESIGKSVGRREDERLLSGYGRFTEDIAPYGLTHASIVRSREAHALIRSIDTHQAKAAPGVIAVLTAQDLGDDLPIIPTDWILPVMTHIPTRYALAKDRKLTGLSRQTHFDIAQAFA
jgi:aerobic carbon-monoxide dehydrogenase large subunit